MNSKFTELLKELQQVVIEIPEPQIQCLAATTSTVLKLTQGRLNWCSEKEKTVDPFVPKNPKYHGPYPPVRYYQTRSYRLTKDTKKIRKISFKGVVLFEQSEKEDKIDGLLNGGGRFYFKRKWHEKKCVATELLIRDLPLHNFGANVPVFEVEVDE